MKQSAHTALLISIKGLADGKHPVELSVPVEQIENISPEFTGMLTVTGTVRRYGKRFLLELTAETHAELLCDVSGEEFEETVVAECSLEYISNTQLALLKSDDADIEPPFYIRDDETKIDITDEIRQELAVRMPLKRVSPKYRDKDFADIFPDYAENSGIEAATKLGTASPSSLDDRWAALKNISFDKR
jgi:Large ribosomal RNA subunit accumulation protein YceD